MIVVTCDTATNNDGTPYEFRVSSHAIGERAVARMVTPACPGTHTVEEFDETDLANHQRARNALAG